MELVIGSQKYEVRPYLISKVGSTENIGFRVYEDGELFKQFDEMCFLYEWMGIILIDETFDLEPEK